MDEKLKEAIELLRKNGYVVKKLTKQQIKDCEECESNDYNGECLFCSCVVCIAK